MPVEARERDLVEVDQPEPADAGAQQRRGRVRADAAEPDDDDEGGRELALASGAEKLPVAGELLLDDLVVFVKEELCGDGWRGAGGAVAVAVAVAAGRCRQTPSRCSIDFLIVVVRIRIQNRGLDGDGRRDPGSQRDLGRSLASASARGKQFLREPAAARRGDRKGEASESGSGSD